MKKLVLASAAAIALGIGGLGAAHARTYTGYYGGNAFAMVLPSQVAQAQRVLARSGFYRGAVDGNLDAATSRALADWQAARGLPTTGGFNPPTMASLGLSTGYPYYYSQGTRYAYRAPVYRPYAYRTPSYGLGYGSSYRPRPYGYRWMGY